MKNIFPVYYVAGYLVLGLLFGCAYGNSVVRVEPKHDADFIVSKAKSMSGDTKSHRENTAGVYIEVLQYVKNSMESALLSGPYAWMNEEKAYTIARNKVMQSLKKEGIDAVLIQDEKDPGIKNIRILVHISYSQEWQQTAASESYPEVKEHYTCKLFDADNGGQLRTTDSLEEMIKAIKQQMEKQ